MGALHDGLFTLASFREVKRSESMEELVRFQTENKMLLLAHHQAEARALGRIAANHDHLPFDDLVGEYEPTWRGLYAAPGGTPPTSTS